MGERHTPDDQQDSSSVLSENATNAARLAGVVLGAPNLLFMGALRYDVGSRCVRFILFGPVYFLSGDSYPNDTHIDRELRRRLFPSFTKWTSQTDIHEPAPESFPMYDFPRRAAHLEDYLAAREPHGSVLIGRSSGSRLVTWYASRHPVSATICLGYPFRNPAFGPEPERYRHLANLKVPTLICQGVRDEYGGSNIFADYPLSPAVRVHLLRTDHDFRLTAEAWDTLARVILEFLQDNLRSGSPRV